MDLRTCILTSSQCWLRSYVKRYLSYSPKLSESTLIVAVDAYVPATSTFQSLPPAMTAFNVESWIWYGIATFMVALRYTARLLHFKDVRKLQLEDWFMLFVWCIYTVLIAFLNICVTASTNLIDPADIPHLTPSDIRERTWGSKCVLVVESCMCFVQWGTKICLLLLYWRLTQNLTQGLVVKITAGYVAITYIVMMSLYYGYWCRPFNNFWKTPTGNIQCATQTHHLIVNLVFNLTSDVLIMSIPLPLLIRQHLELKKKLLLTFPFSLGFFTMICAILSKNLSFNHPFSAEWVYWYCREASTAVIVSNMPYSWAIVRRIFNLKSFFGQNDTSGEEELEGRAVHLDGVSVATASEVRRGTVASWPDNQTRKFSLFTKGEKNMRQVSSISFPGHQNSNFSELTGKDGARNWTTLNVFSKKHIDEEAEPIRGQLSSAGGSSKPPTTAGSQPMPTHDVDRLYCLDDEDLERQASRLDSKRGYEPG